MNEMEMEKSELRRMSHAVKYCFLFNQPGMRGCRLLLCCIFMTKIMSGTQLAHSAKICFCPAADRWYFNTINYQKRDNWL